MSEAENIVEMVREAGDGLPMTLRRAVWPTLDKVGAAVAKVVDRLETRIALLEKAQIEGVGRAEGSE